MSQFSDTRQRNSKKFRDKHSQLAWEAYLMSPDSHKVGGNHGRFVGASIASETPENRHSFDILWHMRELRRLLPWTMQGLFILLAIILIIIVASH